MHKLLKRAIMAAAIALAAFSPEAQAGSQPHKGVIRVKLQPELALKVGNTPRLQTNGVVTTGITPLDRAARNVKAVSIRPMLPYAPKFAEKRAKYGLDRWYVINFDESVSPEEARKVFASTAGVERSEVVTPMSLQEGNKGFRKLDKRQMKAASAAMPFNDPFLSKQWHYQNFGDIPYSVAGADINLFEAWKSVVGSNDVLVAIIDGGIDYTHEDLAPNIYINEAELNGTPGVDDDGNGYVDDIYGWNFCTNEAKIYPHSHGTHVAGTVAAVNNNGIGVAGVAGGDGTPGSGIKMLSCQVFDSRSGTKDGDFAAAIVYAAEKGATIAQCSWGWPTEGYYEQAVLDAIDYFTAEARSDKMTGGLCIFAMGNEGKTGDFYPGCYEKVIGVAAMTSELTPASYSCNGPGTDITAPGGLLDYGELQGVLSTLPGNEYGYNEGTSMATPHVSGIAALVLSKYGSPTFLNETLRTQLLTSVNDFYGYGNNYKVEGNFGTGYIDAAKAVNMNQSGVPEAVSAFDLTAAQDYISVTWTIPASPDNNVNNHLIYYSKEPFSADSNLSAISKKVVDTKFLSSGDSHTEEITGLENLTTYYVAIQAVNRWGNASPLSEVKSVKTNAGPQLTVDGGSLSLETSANNPIASGSFSIGNEAEGILKWEAYKRTVSATLNARRPQPGTIMNHKVTMAAVNAPRATVAAMPEYESEDFPSEITWSKELWAMIGESDKSLPNSMAQWFKVDPEKYPSGFNLTAIKLDAPTEGIYGNNAKIQIYKGDVSISSASMIMELEIPFFSYNYNLNLQEQLWFAPGESFWVVAHFEPGQEGYPLPMGRAKETGAYVNSFMSTDGGETWMQLSEALKGSGYESEAKEFVWGIRAISLNPDWSSMLELDPVSGTVRQGETQAVNVKIDGRNLVNGNYNFNVKLATNETGSKETSVPASISVSGNQPLMMVPKVVDFGSVLVGQSKTLTIEIWNRGYGSFKGSEWSADLYQESISSNSENFQGPEMVIGGFPARSKVRTELTYKPSAAGSHHGVVTFRALDGSEVKVLVQGVATEPAKLSVEPATIDAGVLTLGEEAKELSFTIKNDGKYPLEYVFPKFSDQTVEGGAVLHKFGYTVASTLEGFGDFEYSAVPEMPGATDISSKFNDNIYVAGPFNIGFDFPYYGKNYDKIYVTSFGGVMFAPNESTFRSPLTPDSYGVPGTGLISAYGTQLQMGPGSKVEYAISNGKFVVNFSNVLALVYDQDYAPISFHMALSPNGDIEIFYDDYTAANFFQSGSTLFCGINDPEVADVITVTSSDKADYYGNEEPTPENSRFREFGTGTAVKFEAPQATFVRTLSPAYALVSPGESVEVKASVSVDNSMNAGKTFNNLAIVTNDPSPVVSAVRFDAEISPEGLDAALTVENKDINFGEVFRTSPVTVPVTIKNSGHNVLSVKSVAFESGKLSVKNGEARDIKPGSSFDLLVAIPTDNEGEISDKLTVSTSAGDAVVAISGKVIGCPEATLSLQNVSETIESGTPLTKVIEISNSGNESLSYSFSPDENVKVTVPENENSTTSYAYSAAVDKMATFDWVDIETNGLGEQNTFRYYNSHDFLPVELPFEFTFYGKKYSKMYIYNTGFISFTERRDDKIWPEPPADFPAGSIFTNIIAPYWGMHSMNTTKTAGTYHYVTEDRAVVSFMEYGNSMNIGVCFQVILEKDGSFKFQYKNADEYAVIMGTFGLAGIANEDGSESIRLADRYIAFNNAVTFTPVVENVVKPGKKEIVKLDFNTDRLAGVYESSINLNTNVPLKESIGIPVSLTITGEAIPAIPEKVEIENVRGFRSTDYSNPLVGMGACYDAPFKVANDGTAAFTLTGVKYESPMIHDDFFDMDMPAFTLHGNLPELDWMTGEPTGNYMWQPVNTEFFTPVEVGRKPIEFSVPVMENELWMTPGSYDIPVTLTYVTSADAEPIEKTVNVRITVTPAPAMSLDKEEIRVKAPTEDHLTVETLSIGNEGEYNLSYTLSLDPSGVGKEIELPGGGGIAPTSVRKQAADIDPALSVMADAAFSKKIKLASEDRNAYDLPGDFDYTNALYHDAMPGNKSSWNYGANSLFDVFKESVAFKAPATGINISHIYLPVNIEDQENVTVKIELVSGNDPEDAEVIGKGSLLINSQEDPRTGQFFVVELDKPVYMNPGEEFCVVVTYPEGLKYPSYLCVKEEPVTNGRYMAWTESAGWYDIAELLEDQVGSVGYILTCLETNPGEPWIKLVTETTSGNVEVGSKAEIKVQVNAAAARLEKGNKAVIVLETNDPERPLVNFPVYLDLNGSPVIEAPAAKVYAREGEETIVEIAVTEPDGDNMTISATDSDGIVVIKEASASADDPDAVVSVDKDGSVSVKGALLPVTLKIGIAPDYGQAGKHSFIIAASDDKGHRSTASVTYEVEKVNRAPIAKEGHKVDIPVKSISDVTLFADLFTEPDGDELAFSFNMPENDYAEAFTTSEGVIFQGKSAGTAKATVKATDPEGLSATATITVNVGETSGIDEISGDGSSLVSLVENPVKSELGVICHISGNISLEIFDTKGVSILSQSAEVNISDVIKVDTGALTSGIYLLRASCAGKSEIVRFIKK